MQNFVVARKRLKRVARKGTRRYRFPKGMSNSKRLRNPGKSAAVCLVLGALVWLVFAQTLGFEFTNCDDQTYVTENPKVTSGLTVHGVIWAFTHTVSNNWHPLTVLSHMLDCTLYDLNASGHHFTNVFLHTLVVVLLFLVLSNMTGAFWQSAFVAAVFAIHPLRVESVAWISERKDVLSGIFFMLTLGAYTRYVRVPSPRCYILVIILFALGLMAKPMLVTLPFLLLLLDYWPLKRLTGSRSISRKPKRDSNKQSNSRNLYILVREKIPLFILSAASCVATIIAQRTGIVPTETLSMSSRIGNGFISVMTYVRQMIWPSGLAVLYPFPNLAVSPWQIIASISVVLATSAIAFGVRKNHPYIVVGWLWFLGMLVPVSGVVQVGLQSHADRYTYLPQIGLYILGTWTLADLLASWQRRQIILATTAVVMLAVLTSFAYVQASSWRDSITLWTRDLAVTSTNSAAEDAICSALLHAGRVDEATVHAENEVAIDPDSAQAHTSLGTALLLKRQLDDALGHFEKAVQLRPRDAEAQIGLGNVLLKKGEVAEAVAHYEKAAELDPNSPTKHYNLALALLMQGQSIEAADHLKRALDIQPNYPDADYFLGIVLFRQNRAADAVVHWQRTLKLQPQNWNAASMLAWVFATSRNDSIRDGAKAVGLAESAVKSSRSKDPTVFRALAAAYAETGRFSAAVDAAQEAVRLATGQGNSALVNSLESEIALYQAQTPVRED